MSRKVSFSSYGCVFLGKMLVGHIKTDWLGHKTDRWMLHFYDPKLAKATDGTRYRLLRDAKAAAIRVLGGTDG